MIQINFNQSNCILSNRYEMFSMSGAYFDSYITFNIAEAFIQSN